jgi:hypothetical protein
MNNTIFSNRQNQGDFQTGAGNFSALKSTKLAVLLAVFATMVAVGEETNKVTIPAGTTLSVKLDKAVSSSDKPGTKFSGVLQGDLTNSNAVGVKSGTAVHGQVTDADKAKRVRGKAEVVFELNQINVNGQMVAITTEAVESVGASSTKKTAKGAAKGAAVGAIADGGEGAGRGAAIGAAASGVKKGENAGVQAGAIVEFKLAAPLTVTVKP